MACGINIQSECRTARLVAQTRVESKVGRVSHIQDYGRNNKKVGDYASYAYWGQGDIYQVRLQPDKANYLTFNLDYPFGEKFGSLDTLDRLRFLRWVRAGKTPETAIQFDYGRDRLGLTTRQHLRTSSGAEFWQGFRYDKLDRLIFFQHTPVHRAEEEAKREQTWKLDAAGNWNEWTSRGPNPLHQIRKHTLGDRIQSITNLPKEDPWAQPNYDAAGNLTHYPDPNQPEISQGVRYDAWNRPVGYDANFTGLTYDGLGRLVAKETTEDTRRYTYSPEWQLLEEEVTPAQGSSYRYEYIWGVRGPDDLICREKYTPPSDTPERHYALADANGNIVAVVPESAEGLDRLITYDPYGQPTGQGDFAHLFGGYYYDNQSGLYLVRNRVYHPTLGRWLQKDPLGMVDGTNLYEYCRGNPVNYVDPSGNIAFAPILGWAVSIGLGAYLAKVAIDTAVSTTLEYGVASALGQDFHLGTAIGRNLAGAAIAHAIPGMGEARFAVRAAIWSGQILARSGAEAGVETLIHGGSYWGNFGRIGVGNLGGDLAGRALGRAISSGALRRLDPRNYTYDRAIAGMFMPPLRYDPVEKMYRSVNPGELADIRYFRGFRTKYGEYEGKLFTPSAREAAIESRNLFKDDIKLVWADFPDVPLQKVFDIFGSDFARSIVKVRVRQSVRRQFQTRHTGDYDGDMIFVAENQLDLLNRSLLSLRVLQSSPLR